MHSLGDGVSERCFNNKIVYFYFYFLLLKVLFLDSDNI